MSDLHYGRRLIARVRHGQLKIVIGARTLAHAVTYAEWANPYDENLNDYIRTFAIADPQGFAEDVVRAMLREREDGSTPLSDFLDKMAEAAVEDGSLACEYDEIKIQHGHFAVTETWSKESP